MFRCFGDRLRSPYSDHPDHMRDALTESRVDAKMTDVAFVRHLRQSPYWQTLSNRAQLRVLNRCLVSAIDLYSQVVRVQDAVFADIEVLGAKIVREKFPDDTLLIFVTVPGTTVDEKVTVLRQRMEARLKGEKTASDVERVHERIDRARNLEFPFEAECDFVIVNDEKDRAVDELEQYILSKIAVRKQEMVSKEA